MLCDSRCSLPEDPTVPFVWNPAAVDDEGFPLVAGGQGRTGDERTFSAFWTVGAMVAAVVVLTVVAVVTGGAS